VFGIRMKHAVKADGLRKIFGLMFRTRKTSPLVFEFKNDVHIAIHSFFVFFPFRAIWLDENNKIIEQKTVRPFTFSVCPKRPFRKLIEIPQ
jgi:uncharacterized membrane protein (UPF0127 family)